MSQLVRGLLVTGLALSLSLNALQAQTSTKLSDAEEELAIQASKRIAQVEAAKLLLFASLIVTESGEVIEVSRDVRVKYHSSLAATIAPIPTALLGGSFVYLAQESFDEVQFVFRSLNTIFEPIKRFGAHIATAIAEVLDNAIFRASSEVSAHISEAVWGIVKPLAALVFNKGAAVSSATLLVGSSLSGMSFMIFHDAEAALDYEKMRDLLGYDKQVQSRLDSLIADLGVVYQLDANSREKLRDIIKEELIRQAAENDFADDAEYDVDIIDIMAQEGMISNDLALVTKGLRGIFDQASKYRQTELTALESLTTDLETMALMGATIEEYLNQGVLSEDRAKEAAHILENLERTMDIVRKNFL